MNLIIFKDPVKCHHLPHNFYCSSRTQYVCLCSVALGMSASNSSTRLVFHFIHIEKQYMTSPELLKNEICGYCCYSVHNIEENYLTPSLSVHLPAFLPYFSLLLHTDISQLHHGSRKFPEEEPLVFSERLNQPPCPVIAKQCLIRSKHSLSR